MKSFGVSLALVLVVALASGCGSKGLPVIGRGAAPVPAAESEKAVSAFEAEPTISEKIKQLLDENETLGWDADGECFYVEVSGGFWYHEWIDNFHSTIRKLTGEDTCFSEVPEAEGEAAFWTAVHQIDTHPDKYSGRLNIPRNCDEAREWASTVFSALKKGEEDTWCDPEKGCWINTLPERLAAHSEYDPR